MDDVRDVEYAESNLKTDLLADAAYYAVYQKVGKNFLVEYEMMPRVADEEDSKYEEEEKVVLGKR